MNSNEYEKNLLEEYKMLREEIMQMSLVHFKSEQFLITSVAAVLAFAVAHENEYIALLSFIIIIYQRATMAAARENVAKIAAYMIVHIEPKIKGLSWETNNAKLCNNSFGTSRIYNLNHLMSSFPHIYASIAAVIVYVYEVDKSQNFSLLSIVCSNVLSFKLYIAFILVSLTIVDLCCEILYFNKRYPREKAKKEWEKIFQSK